jgi:hypothetical protein
MTSTQQEHIGRCRDELRAAARSLDAAWDHLRSVNSTSPGLVRITEAREAIAEALPFAVFGTQLTIPGADDL